MSHGEAVANLGPFFFLSFPKNPLVDGKCFSCFVLQGPPPRGVRLFCVHVSTRGWSGGWLQVTTHLVVSQSLHNSDSRFFFFVGGGGGGLFCFCYWRTDNSFKKKNNECKRNQALSAVTPSHQLEAVLRLARRLEAQTTAVIREPQEDNSRC